jgi:hypothetical protein
MTLLQAAFSHNGFAQHFDGRRDGAFRDVVAKATVSGPIVITHTANDVNVGKMYPLASLVVGDDAAALGDENDRFGGIGRNGAVKTPEAVKGTLLPLTGAYALMPGRLHNLESTSFIANHSDVTGREVAKAILAAVAG